MSFSFRVKFVEGEGTVTDVSGTPPEAPLAISVSGHSDAYQTSIGAGLIGENGSQVIGASATGRAS